MRNFLIPVLRNHCMTGQSSRYFMMEKFFKTSFCAISCSCLFISLHWVEPNIIKQLKTKLVYNVKSLCFRRKEKNTYYIEIPQGQNIFLFSYFIFKDFIALCLENLLIYNMYVAESCFKRKTFNSSYRKNRIQLKLLNRKLLLNGTLSTTRDSTFIDFTYNLFFIPYCKTF